MYSINHILTHIIHNGNLFIFKRQTSSLPHCSLDSLLASVQVPSPFSVWREFEVPSETSQFFSLGNQVIAAGNVDPSAQGPMLFGFGTMKIKVSQRIKRTPKMCALSPFTRMWVQVGDIPYSYQHAVFSGFSSVNASLISLLTGEVVLLVTQGGCQQRAMKASVKSKSTYYTSCLNVISGHTHGWGPYLRSD